MNSPRVLFIMMVVFVVLIVLIGKLFTIQITNHDKYVRIASRQQSKTVKIKAERGVIKDRNGTLLTFTKNDVSLFVDTRMTNNKEKLKIAKRFAKLFGKSQKYYLNKLNSAKKNICLEKKASKSKISELIDFMVSGYFQVEDYSRVYPYGSLASHLLGFVDRKLKGVAGVEKKFDKYLTGKDGYKYIETDAQGRIVTVNQNYSVLPQNGYNVELTIDINYQKILEEEVTRGLKKYKGKSATAIIMNPNSGEILAWTNQPDYDPANYNLYSDFERRNRAVTDTYEPGSTIKPLVMSILLEKGLASEHEIINTDNGKYKVRGATIRDAHKFKKLSVTEIISHSSNIGIAKLSDRIDDETFYKYLRDYGFGNLTSIDLPGEAAGQLKKPRNYSKLSKKFISFGYEIAVTPIQLLTAYCALVNGGELLQPYVVKKIKDNRGNIVEEFSKKRIRKIISANTSERVVKMMKETVETGTAVEAKLAGIEVGGKTGTAQRLLNNKYSSKDYNSSFIGFFPADNPQYVILVLVSSPEIGKYGGKVAAPIFRNIAARIVDSDKNIIPQKDKTGIINDAEYVDNNKKENLFVTANLSPATKINRKHNSNENKTSYSKFPNLINFSKRAAIKTLNDLGIKYQIAGTGKVIWQSVEPGKNLKDIDVCKIKCATTKINKRLRIN